jgi:alkanesulfonate monooxygenase SsuD/methylene tetrahydromethanopterin reductase-like flavin-dependent oxidoreductase (luciferase family)
MEVLDERCREIGRDPGAIRRSAQALLVLSEDAKLVEQVRASGRPVIAGSVADVQRTVQEYAAAGVDELIVPGFNLGPPERATATLDRFISEVAPACR